MLPRAQRVGGSLRNLLPPPHKECDAREKTMSHVHASAARSFRAGRVSDRLVRERGHLCVQRPLMPGSSGGDPVPVVQDVELASSDGAVVVPAIIPGIMMSGFGRSGWSPPRSARPCGPSSTCRCWGLCSVAQTQRDRIERHDNAPVWPERWTSGTLRGAF